jgi:2-keto-4-pentenoate hydratase/2-oxohepta-3-ene-1,7-dioic acid hydratase in catechol pathway
MRFITFAHSDHVPLPGLLVSDSVHDLRGACFATVLDVIRGGSQAIAAIHAFIKAGAVALPLDQVQLLAPIPNPPRIFGIGFNYADHAAESRMQVQPVPTVFLKLSSSFTGPGTNILLPSNSTQPDYEAELGVVIAKSGYRISAADWQEHVFGYTIVNDVSARDIQLATTQWTLGKSFPTFTPLGPSVVTSEEIPDPHTLDIRLSIDGEVLQSANTKDLLFRVPQLIEYISSITPLEAGDIISTGTPPGVGLGRSPQRWLRPNEEIVIHIPHIGELRNRTLAEA